MKKLQITVQSLQKKLKQQTNMIHNVREQKHKERAPPSPSEPMPASKVDPLLPLSDLSIDELDRNYTAAHLEYIALKKARKSVKRQEGLQLFMKRIKMECEERQVRIIGSKKKSVEFEDQYEDPYVWRPDQFMIPLNWALPPEFSDSDGETYYDDSDDESVMPTAIYTTDEIREVLNAYTERVRNFEVHGYRSECFSKMPRALRCTGKTERAPRKFKLIPAAKQDRNLVPNKPEKRGRRSKNRGNSKGDNSVPQEPEYAEDEPEAVAEEPEVVSEEREAVPEEIGAVPEEYEAVPEDPEAVPEEPEAVPEESEAVPEEPEAVLEESEAVPEEPEAVPEEPEVMQEEPEAVPVDMEEEVADEPAAVPKEPEVVPETAEDEPKPLEKESESLADAEDKTGTEAVPSSIPDEDDNDRENRI